MNRSAPLGGLLGLATLAAALLAPAAQAQTAPAAKSTGTKVAVAKKPATKSASRQELHSQAQGLALATEVTEQISANQLEISNRVLTGTAQCEFNQTVSVDPMQDKPGHFRVAFNQAVYTMTPQETSTGAVRLEDKRNGIVWLQIPSKSMMMNQKVGQRMVDGCTVAQQRGTVAQAAGAR